MTRRKIEHIDDIVIGDVICDTYGNDGMEYLTYYLVVEATKTSRKIVPILKDHDNNWGGRMFFVPQAEETSVRVSKHGYLSIPNHKYSYHYVVSDETRDAIIDKYKASKA